MSSLQVVGNMCCHINLLANERVPQCKEKGIAKLFFVRPDQVVKSLRVLWSIEGLKPHGIRLLADFVESDEGCTPQAMLTQVVDTLLCISQRFNNYEVQVTACCRYCYVVLVIDSAQVSQSTMHTL